MPRLPDFWQEGVRFSFPYRAEPVDIPGKGTFPQKFMPGAFDSSLGNTVPLKISGEQVGWARVVAADVAEDGLSVLFTYEITQLFASGDGMPAGTGDPNDTQ